MAVETGAEMQTDTGTETGTDTTTGKGRERTGTTTGPLSLTGATCVLVIAVCNLSLHLREQVACCRAPAERRHENGDARHAELAHAQPAEEAAPPIMRSVVRRGDHVAAAPPDAYARCC